MRRALLVPALFAIGCANTVIDEEAVLSGALVTSPSAAPATCAPTVDAALAHATSCSVHAPLHPVDAATCSAADACVATCVVDASCDALNGDDPAGLATYLACVHTCITTLEGPEGGGPPVGGAPGSSGAPNGSSGGSSGSCDCSGGEQ